jgi:glutathione S-transferase
LNNHLQGKDHVVGNRTTLADIILFTSYLNFFRFAADPEFIKPFPNVVSWYTKLAAADQFKKVVPDFKFPEKEFAPNSIKF